MTTITITAKSVEEAVSKGIEELKTNKDNVEVEVIKEPSAGFLGFLGSKQAEVKITIKQKPLDYMQDFLISLLAKMHLQGEVDAFVKEEKTLYLVMEGPDMGILIGRRGQTLNSLQYLLNVILHRKFDTDARLIVDVEGYRSRREKTLQRLAISLARNVVATGKSIALEPMPPQERRIIHMALQENSAVVTYSEGEGSLRKVVITIKINKSRS